MTLISSKASLERSRRFTRNLTEAEEQQKAKEEAAKAELDRQTEAENDKMLAAVASTSRKRRQVARELEEVEEAYHHNFSKTITSLMAYITTEAVLLDSVDAKAEIFKQFQEAYEFLYEEDQISLEASPTFQKLGGRVATYVSSADHKLTDEEISNIVSFIYVDDPEMIHPLISLVQDKVATSVKEEKKAIVARQNLSEDQQVMSGYLNRKAKAPSKTLFRKLLEDGMSSSIDLNDPITLTEEATSLLMENSLDEAVAIYTLLETLNTSKLRSIPRRELEEFINYK